MYKKLFHLAFIVILGLAYFATPKQSVQAKLSNMTTCKLTSGFSYTVSAALGANGLVYVALADAGGTAEINLRSKAQIIIHVVDPNNPNCKILATYRDTSSYTSLSALVTPPIARADSAGNIYVGKIDGSGFRTIYIPSGAPASAPLSGLKATTITGLSGYVTHGGMAITSKHILMAAAVFTPGSKLFTKYAVLPISTVQRGGMTSASWATFSSMSAYGPAYSANDSVEGLPDGRFYMAGSFENSGYPKFVGGHAFLNPTTMDLTGAISKKDNNVDLMPCDSKSLLMIPYGCFYPSARLGADNDLYVAYGTGESGTGTRMTYAMKYDTSTMKWSGVNGVLFPERISAFNGKDASGVSLAADNGGNLFAAGTNGLKQSLILAYRDGGKWADGGYNVTNTEYSKPAILFTPYESGVRLSVFVVTFKSSGTDIIWTTHSGDIDVALNTCSQTVMLENGAAAINKTSASGIIYVGKDCTAAFYVAKVTATSAVPTSAIAAGEYKAFDLTSPTMNVTGLTANDTNYVHVKMFDKSRKPVSGWRTVKIYADTTAAVGATTALSSPYTTQRYTDELSMGGASFADPNYVRTMVGRFAVTAVTDPSELDNFEIAGKKYPFNDGMVGVYQSTLLSNGTGTNAGKVGVTVKLTDGAGNTEERAVFPLTFDATAPVIATPPTPTFTVSAGSYNGSVALAGGSVTDDLYVGPAGAQHWGVWVANAVCTAPGSCPTVSDATLRWAPIKTADATATSTSFSWNVRSGLTPAAVTTGNEYYKTYIKFLDGAGNPTSTEVSFETTVATTANSLFVPFVRPQR